MLPGIHLEYDEVNFDMVNPFPSILSDYVQYKTVKQMNNNILQSKIHITTATANLFAIS